MTIFTEVNPRTFLPLEGSQTMPRTKTTTAETLERQAAADSKLGDLDEQGNERLPEFNGLEPQNGHIPEGVRPSERCGTPSPLGIGCTFKEHDAGRHSWQPDPERTPQGAGLGAFDSNSWEAAGTVEGEQQPTLPGTPEPVETDHSIPSEAKFGGKDFLNSSGLKAIGERLIAERPTLAHLVDVEIRYLWKRRGGSSGGNPKLGALQRPGGLLKYFTGGVTFIAWLAADNSRELLLPADKIEANLFHQLLHAEINPEDDDAYRIRGHDFEGFVDELDAYGPWSADFREMHAHVANTPLEQAIDETGADDGEEEGEESE